MRTELPYVLTNNFVACVSVRFYFFHCRSFLPCWPLRFLIFSPPPWNFNVFLPNSSLLFLVTRSSSFYVIHVSVDIKITLKKTRLFYFFPLKVRVAMGFPAKKTTSCIWFAIPVVWVILHRYTCGADGRRVTWPPNFLTHGAPLGTLGTRKGSAKIQYTFNGIAAGS